MPDAAWKAFERRVAKVFGGERRGPDYRSTGTAGKSDVIAPGWSIECKLYEHPTFQVMLDAAKQAEINRPRPNDIPIAIVKRKVRGSPDKDALVVMRYRIFCDYFGCHAPSFSISYHKSNRPTWENILKAVKRSEDLATVENGISLAQVTRESTADNLSVMRFEIFTLHYVT